jgi:NADPH:quinone reductase-like Zn-dependent oxidoreductase
MKVIQMQRGGGPEVLELEEKPLPQPAAGEVRVRAEAIGISSADMLVRKGVYNWMPPLPAIPGNEMAGIVDVLGRDVSDVRVGQRVLVSSRELSFRGGCYAQATCVPATSYSCCRQRLRRMTRSACRTISSPVRCCTNRVCASRGASSPTAQAAA